MISREQIARAIGAIAAGFAIAFEHLREPVEPDPSEPTGGCPICHRPLTEPHVHDLDVFWPTDEAGVILITDLAGGDTFVVGGAE